MRRATCGRSRAIRRRCAPARWTWRRSVAFVHGSEALPLVAVNPRTGGDVVFSAAPIGPREQPTGYVYAVLGGAAVEAAMMESGGSYRMTLALASFLACLVFLLVTGLLLFRTLTGRLQRFADRVDRFHASGFAPVPEAGPPEAERGDDEIARIGQAFDAMAVKINAQFAQLAVDRPRPPRGDPQRVARPPHAARRAAGLPADAAAQGGCADAGAARALPRRGAAPRAADERAGGADVRAGQARRARDGAALRDLLARRTRGRRGAEVPAARSASAG